MGLFFYYLILLELNCQFINDIFNICRDKKAIQIDTVRDGLDLILPGSALEIIQVETGVVGIVGSITSLIMAYQIWGK